MISTQVTYRLIDPRHGLEQRLRAFLLFAQAVAFAGASLGYLIACLSPDSEFATVVAPLFVFPMILLGGLYANVGAIPVGARWINKVCLRARNFDAPYAIDATRSPHRSTL